MFQGWTIGLVVKTMVKRTMLPISNPALATDYSFLAGNVVVASAVWLLPRTGGPDEVSGSHHLACGGKQRTKTCSLLFRSDFLSICRSQIINKTLGGVGNRPSKAELQDFSLLKLLKKEPKILNGKIATSLKCERWVHRFCQISVWPPPPFLCWKHFLIWK